MNNLILYSSQGHDEILLLLRYSLMLNSFIALIKVKIFVIETINITLI